MSRLRLPVFPHETRITSLQEMAQNAEAQLCISSCHRSRDLLLVASLRSLGLVPAALLAPTAFLANVLTTVSMAALGLGVDVCGRARRTTGIGSGHPFPYRAGSDQPWADPYPSCDTRAGILTAFRRRGSPTAMDFASLCGYYALLAIVPNTAQTPLPEGAELFQAY